MIYKGFIATANGYYSKNSILKIDRYFYRSDKTLITFTDGTEHVEDGNIIDIINKLEGIKNGKN